MKRIVFLLIFLNVVSAPAKADDTVVGMAAGGLEFRTTADISMTKETLTISPSQVIADYLFDNLTDRKVELMIAFPLPIVDLSKVGEHSPYINLANPNSTNFIDFKTFVNSVAVQTQTEVKAMLGNKDISVELAKLGLKYGVPGHAQTDRAILVKQLQALDKKSKNHLISMGAIDVYQEGTDQIVEPKWKIVTLYYWTQSFAPRERLNIKHEYRPVAQRSAGGFAFLFQDDKGKQRMPVLHGNKDARYPSGGKDLKQFCMPDDFWRQASLKRDLNLYEDIQIDFILKTANAWHKPIGDFTFVIQTPSPDTLIATCMNGVERQSDTSYQVKINNFIPSEDIKLFFLVNNQKH